MVDEVTPNYYAAGVWSYRFTIRGHGLEYIPDDAVAITARDNNTPLAERDAVTDFLVLHIAERDGNSVTFETGVEHTYTVPRYLSAILSAERETVYWVNDTKPLP